MTKVTRTSTWPDRVALLAAIPYLRAAPPADLRALAARCVVREVRRGATVFREGEPAEGLFVVVDGRVKIVRVSARGREQVLHTEGPGATLGEVPLLDGGGYVASAIAAAPSRLLFLPRPALLDLCRRRPAIAMGIIRVLARRVRTFAGLIEDLSLRDVTARLAAYLLDEAQRQGAIDVTLAGTRDDIAATLGTVRELVSRSLARLRRAGAITIAGRRVRIVDAARLARIAGR
ncbi:MAG: Crp/Fnr family transcriptional regulator [Candidatus Rokubacteria bacterium]|nr:Crp/Fnr family transcriptional regulator [Candidatus Rokubacteria bacterium]